jgi:hypothetical protein
MWLGSARTGFQVFFRGNVMVLVAKQLMGKGLELENRQRACRKMPVEKCLTHEPHNVIIVSC